MNIEEKLREQIKENNILRDLQFIKMAPMFL